MSKQLYSCVRNVLTVAETNIRQGLTAGVRGRERGVRETGGGEGGGRWGVRGGRKW